MSKQRKRKKKSQVKKKLRREKAHALLAKEKLIEKGN